MAARSFSAASASELEYVSDRYVCFSFLPALHHGHRDAMLELYCSAGVPSAVYIVCKRHREREQALFVLFWTELFLLHQHSCSGRAVSCFVPYLYSCIS